MKKTITVITLLAGAVSGYSQGAIDFAGYVAGFKQQIFNVQATPPANGTLVPVSYNAGDGLYTVLEYQGSSTGTLETPAGTVAYASGTALSGTGFDATLLGVAGTATLASQLSVLGGNLNFYTATAALGFIENSLTVTVPGTSTGSPVATIAIAAWQDTGAAGAATTLAAAQSDNYAWGISALAQITTTFGGNAPASMSTASDVNLSFSLGTVPEPSTIALGVIGASALLFRRRK